MLAYFKPTTIEEALKLKAEANKGVFLSGGTGLNSLGWAKQVAKGRVKDYDTLIDVSELDMGETVACDGYVRFNANMRFQDVLGHALCPALLRAGLKQVVNRNVRNMATLGGAIASKSPCSNIATALVALHADVELKTVAGEQIMSVEEYQAGDIKEGLIVGIRIPQEWTELNCSTRRYSRSNNDISILLADIALECKGERITKISAVAGGVGPHLIRLKSLEKALIGCELPEITKVAELVKMDINTIDDFRGSAAFKTHTICEIVDWCLHQATDGIPCCKCGHEG